MSPVTHAVNLGYPRARIVETLLVDELPQGVETRLMVELVHDGLSRPIHIPVLVVRGTRPGPVVGITAALHGNEVNGLPVIHRLFDQLDVTKLRGTLVGVCVVNVPAFLNNERTFGDRTDLNHIMPGKANGNDTDVYAYRLLDRLVRHFDYLIDLHTASFGRVNSLYVRADMKNPTTAKMAYLQRPEIIVHNPASDSTLRGAAIEHDTPAITVEIGDPQVFQPKYIRHALTGIRRVLADFGMIPKRKVSPGPPPVVCERSFWLFADYGGLLQVFPDVLDRVERGEIVAHQRNIFGDVIRTYRSPEEGIVIGKSTNPVGPTGARILHLGIPVSDETSFHLRGDEGLVS